MLKKRPLGATGLLVSPLGLGTVKFGRNEKVKYPSAFDLPGDETVTALLDETQRLGINLLDTAPAYGTAEEVLGRCVKNWDDWVLCTKVGEIFENGESHYDFSADHLRRSVESSLERLKTDRLDILLLHLSPETELEALTSEEVYNVLADLKRQGIVRATGASIYSEAGGQEALARYDTVMCALNPLYTGDLPTIRRAAQAGKGVLIKKGLVSGNLAELGADPVATCFESIFSEPGIGSVIVGTLNPAHLRENAARAATATKRLKAAV